MDRAYLAIKLAQLRQTSFSARRTAMAYLLAISDDRTPLVWGPPGTTWLAKGTMATTSPRDQAIKALEKMKVSIDLVLLARDVGTLAGDRAWSVIEEWLRPGAGYAGRYGLFPAAAYIPGRDIGPYLLPFIKDIGSLSKLTAYLEAIRRRVPGVEACLADWLESADWKQQASAAYGLAVFDTDLGPFEARLSVLSGSDRRIVRSAVALATKAPGVSAVDSLGAARADRVIRELSRGFLRPGDESYVDLSLPLPDLDLSAEGPLLVAVSKNRVVQGPSRESTIRELERTYPCLQWAQDPRATALAMMEAQGQEPSDSHIHSVVTLAVLEREPDLFLDPDVEGRWLQWPDLYYCYLDTEQDAVLGAHSGPFGERLLRVPADVEAAARQVFERVGLQPDFHGVQGGVILVAHTDLPVYLGMGFAPLIQRRRQQLASLVGSIDGRTLSATETRWRCLVNVPLHRRREAAAGSGYVHLVMARGATEDEFQSDLVFAPTAGVISSVTLHEYVWGSPTGYQVDIDGSDGKASVSRITALGVGEGDRVERGQWIGMRW